MARQVRIVGNQQNEIQSLSNIFDSGHSILKEPQQTSSWELNNRHASRSPQILEAVKNLDLTSNPVYRQQLIDWLRQAYQERSGGQLMAIFSKCYLGYPYQDHYVSLAGNIVEHYKSHESVPPMFSRARPLALSPAYAYIEVYSDGEVVPVAEDGSER